MTSKPFYILLMDCSGPHLTSTHKCNIVGGTVKQGSRCSHTQYKRPNCKGNHITFSSRCAKRVEATRDKWERRRREPAGWTTQTPGPTSGANRTALGQRTRALDVGERGGSGEEMADADEYGGEAEDVTITESAMPTTMAMPTPPLTGTTTVAGTGIEHGNGMGASMPDV